MNKVGLRGDWGRSSSAGIDDWLEEEEEELETEGEDSFAFLLGDEEDEARDDMSGKTIGGQEAGKPMHSNWLEVCGIEFVGQELCESFR